MRKIILASAVALGVAAMMTSALAAVKVRPAAAHFATTLCRYPSFAPATCHQFLGPSFGFFAVAWGPWWYDDDCWDGLRWVLTPRGWSWQACIWP